MIIDAHQHLWQIGENGHEWPGPDLPAIYRDVLPEDLMAATDGTGVKGTVLVQSQPSDLDTDWMLNVASATPIIRAVVGWVDFSDPEAPKRVRALAQAPKFRGLRPMLQGLPKDDWILDPVFAPVFRAMIDEGLTFDALIYTRHLPVIDILARRYPALSIIIDHGAKPPLAVTHPPDALRTWHDAIGRVAEHSHVTCKISGLPVEISPSQPEEAMIPCMDRLRAVFGSGRILWGSDWPVCTLRMTYAGWLSFVSRWLTTLPPSERSRIIGGNARDIYRLA